MVKLGILQTFPHISNQKGIEIASKMLNSVGKKETDIICLPEQWQKENRLGDFDAEFSVFKKIAREYSMTIIPGAFYQKNKSNLTISAPVIGPTGEIIGVQEKIHPFDYEKNLVKAGTKTCIFKTSCKFGIIICYDMVFPHVAESLVKKGAQVLLSPSRIVRRGIRPWHIYVQARALENRVPILAANVQNRRFGGKSIVVDLIENNGVMIPKIITLQGQGTKSASFDLRKYEKSRKIRYSDKKRIS